MTLPAPTERAGYSREWSRVILTSAPAKQKGAFYRLPSTEQHAAFGFDERSSSIAQFYISRVKVGCFSSDLPFHEFCTFCRGEGEQSGGWRLFYGGWDGQDVPFDQIYSTTTTDFLSFGPRDNIISNGAFLNVNNVNVQQVADGSLHMICTGGQAGNVDNFPVYFQSPDGSTWNGVPEPYPAQLTDIIQMQGYDGFSSGNFNGANVLLRDNATWVLYFKDWNHLDTTYRTTADTLPIFQFQGVALKDNGFVNDIKKITVNGQSTYLMGLVGIDPKQSIFYSLSNDGVNFSTVQTAKNLNRPRFWRVKSKLPQSLAQCLVDTESVCAVLETHYKVVDVSH